jgi:hypothetical protein
LTWLQSSQNPTSEVVARFAPPGPHSAAKNHFYPSLLSWGSTSMQMTATVRFQRCAGLPVAVSPDNPCPSCVLSCRRASSAAMSCR